MSRYMAYCDCCLAPIDLRYHPDEMCDDCHVDEEQQLAEMELVGC